MLFTEKLNLKRPDVGGANPLHQDYPYWVGRSRRTRRSRHRRSCSSTTRTVDNGCLQVVPGSHATGCGRPAPTATVRRQRDRPRRVRRTSSSVPLELRGRVGRDVRRRSSSTTPPPNTSRPRRRALLFSYQPPGRAAHARVAPSPRCGVPVVSDTTLPSGHDHQRRGARGGVSPATVSRVLNGTGPVSPAAGRAGAGRGRARSATSRPGRRGRCGGSVNHACGRRSSPTSRTRSSPRGPRHRGRRPQPRTTASCSATPTRTWTRSGPTSTSSSPSAWPASSSRSRRPAESDLAAPARPRHPRRRRRPPPARRATSTRSSSTTALGAAEATAPPARRTAAVAGRLHHRARTRRHGNERLARLPRRASPARRADRPRARASGRLQARRAATAPPGRCSSRHAPPDALFVANNLMTIGALRALRELGVPRPRRRRARRLRRRAVDHAR